MNTLRKLLDKRAKRIHFRGLHGQDDISKKRRFALIMVETGVFRTVFWIVVAILYACGVPAIVHAFSSVAFVALISVWALVETAWGQAAASWAQLTAGDVHQVAEETHKDVRQNYADVEKDIVKLANLHPGHAADVLVASICERLRTD